MVRAKFETHDRPGPVTSPGPVQQMGPRTPRGRAGFGRWRWIAPLSALVPLSFALVQCGQAPSAATLAANSQAAIGDTFDERFPKPTTNESFARPQPADA